MRGSSISFCSSSAVTLLELSWSLFFWSGVSFRLLSCLVPWVFFTLCGQKSLTFIMKLSRDFDCWLCSIWFHRTVSDLQLRWFRVFISEHFSWLDDGSILPGLNMLDIPQPSSSGSRLSWTGSTVWPSSNQWHLFHSSRKSLLSWLFEKC